MFNTRITNLGSEVKNFGPHVNLVTGAGAAVAFTAVQLPGPQKYVLLQVQGQITRISYDGIANPTAADGERKNAGDETLLLLSTVLKMKFITEAGAGNIWAQPCDVT